MSTPGPGQQASRSSMDLLRTVQREALDPDYREALDPDRTAAGARLRPRRSRRARVVGVALAAMLLSMAAAQTSRSAPGAADERKELIAHIATAQSRQAESRAEIARLDAELRRLQAQQLPLPAPSQRNQAALAGMAAVRGPGIVLTLTDAPAAGSQETTRISDQDLRVMVNGLWSAGAEALALNGHRITARTAIRAAGSAITVDYISITSPYRLEAIGDPQHLPGALATTRGGQWWSFLHSNYQVGYQVAQADDLQLGADPGLGATRAVPQK